MKKPPIKMLEAAVLAARAIGVFVPNKKVQLALSMGKQLARGAIRAQKLQIADADKAVKKYIRETAKSKGLKVKDVAQQVSRIAGKEA
jgi:tRNA 2-selenouridine synthase SelU